MGLPTAGRGAGVVVAITVGFLFAFPANASGRDRTRPSPWLVSYLAQARDRSNGLGVEWHLLDPATQRDSILVRLSGWPAAIRFNRAKPEVTFALEGALQRMSWEWGAQPWPEVALPASPRCIDVWVDQGAGSCWLVSGDVIYLEKNAFPGQLCRYDFWRGASDGQGWSIVRRETTDCVNFSWTGWTSTRSIEPGADAGVSLWSQQSSATPDQWGLPPQPISPPSGQNASGPKWYFVGSRTLNGIGLAYRMEASRGRSSKGPAGHEWFVTAPFFLMDRAHRSERVLDAPDFGPLGQLARLGMEERDGFVLVSGDRAYLYDLRTGEQLLPRSARSPIVWVPQPAPARADTAGLERLRARFETRGSGPPSVR